MTFPYYSPSGQVPRAGVLIVAMVSLVAFPSAWVYAWVISQVMVVFNPLVAWGIGVWLGVLVRYGAARGKIRNPRWMGWAGVCMGLLAWYVQWAAWIAINNSADIAPDIGVSVIKAVVGLCADPGTMVQVAVGVVESNTSSFLKWCLIFSWLVELYAHLVPPGLAGRQRASAPFCETTDRWAEEVEVPVQFQLIAEPEVVRRRLESDPEHILAVLVPRAERTAGSFAALTLYRCPGVDSFITIKNFIEMAPGKAPLPAELRNLMVAMPNKVECFAEAEEPVVELLRLPIPDPDALLRHWAEAVDALSTDTRAGTTG